MVPVIEIAHTQALELFRNILKEIPNEKKQTLSKEYVTKNYMRYIRRKYYLKALGDLRMDFREGAFQNEVVIFINKLLFIINYHNLPMFVIYGKGKNCDREKKFSFQHRF